MRDHDRLASEFESHRGHLIAVAYRMLGAAADADDAVQETWLRLARADVATIENLRGWLTTVVSRICLDMLRTRASRREERIESAESISVHQSRSGSDPERAAMLADSAGRAMLVVLETLAPAERVAFVLHDLFAVPFEEIAAILDRSPAATKQLASRARRRVQQTPATPAVDPHKHADTVRAFLSAARDGNLAGLLGLLAPDVVLRADHAGIQMGAAAEVVGMQAVAETFSGRARGARAAYVDGVAAAVWAAGGQLRVLFEFDIRDGVVTQMRLIADSERLTRVTVEYLEAEFA